MTFWNVKRIEKVIEHHKLEEEEKQDAIAALLADTMHYCNEHQFNFWELQEQAHQFWKKERGL